MSGRMLIGVFVCVLFLAACVGGEGEGNMKKDGGRVVRRAQGGGRWFPGTRAELSSMVSNCIEKAEVPAAGGRVVAAIAPHAGYVYSGKVAGYTFRAIRESVRAGNAVDTAVVLGFTHREPFRGVALMDGDAIETPLGETELDNEAAAILTNASRRIFMNYAPHPSEHSAENEIPFVQAALPGVKLAVGLIGDHDAGTLKEIVKALNELAAKKKIVVIASTDMLHDPDYDLVTRTDKATLASVAAMDHAGLLKSWGYSKQIFCGIMPVQAAMQFAESQGCRKGTVLHYRNNGDDDPSSRGTWVVGYGAAVFAVSK